MKAYHLTGTKGLQDLKQVEIAPPTPAADQVLIKVKACSLNYRDWMICNGEYRVRLNFPVVPLSDGAGEVVAVGDRVTKFKVGDRVAGCFMSSWLEGPQRKGDSSSSLGGQRDGMLSELVALSQESVVAVPNHLDDAEAACLPCAALTAWNAMFEAHKLTAGQTVLIQGTGGVSIFALQFAKMAGAQTIVTSSSDEKLARAKALGADLLINYSKTPEWDQEVSKLTGDEGVDLVVEVGGAGTFDRSLRAARIGGSVAVIGVLTGGSAPIQTVNILARTLRVYGIYVGSRAMFESMNRAIFQNELKPVISKRYKFADAKLAIEELKKGNHFGKTVIEVGV